MKKEKINERIENLKEEIRKLEEEVNKPEIEYYEVETPVDSWGDILFNNNLQVLYSYDGLYSVHFKGQIHADCKDLFVWVPCKREDLKCGDTAYRTDVRNVFTPALCACKILNDNEYVYISLNDKDILTRSNSLNYWYKLVRKSDLNL